MPLLKRGLESILSGCLSQRAVIISFEQISSGWRADRALSSILKSQVQNG
ncbi:hypothetical protein BN440_1810 [Erwinia amylovora MR1]|nr:hypothetical protein BN440_1810 [Erwinia amylovora MR1]